MVSGSTPSSSPNQYVVGRAAVLGMQFHPEKSQAVGLRLVANFVRLCASRRAIA